MNALSLITSGLNIYERLNRKKVNALTIVTDGMIFYGRMKDKIKTFKIDLKIQDRFKINLRLD